MRIILLLTVFVTLGLCQSPPSSPLTEPPPAPVPVPAPTPAPTPDPAPTPEQPRGQAILITGGSRSRGDDYLRSVELFLPSDGSTCSLPELPQGRSLHSQDAKFSCGGFESTTCDKWSHGNWTRSDLTLRQKRGGHVSWATAAGVYLMGGHYSKMTSELVKEDGSVEEGFPLEYKTEWACAVPDREEVIITGGYNTRTTVSVYTAAGHQRNLAPLTQGRRLHACTSFTHKGEKFMIVAGGWDGSVLDSTEIYSFSDDSWTVAGKLPAKMDSMRAATINNRVLLLGGRAWKIRDNILKYDPETKEWTEVGTMKEARYGQGVSVVEYSDFADFCS